MNIPFEITDWNKIPTAENEGKSGYSRIRGFEQDGLKVRIVEYSADYLADHWCEKGHIVYCIDGECELELSDGRKFVLTKGMGFQVSDNLGSHRIFSKKGVKFFIVDGEFLK